MPAEDEGYSDPRDGLMLYTYDLRICGFRWNYIKKEERKKYLKNAYRVLLTRARQGMVIVVPLGDPEDPTCNPTFYDPTFEYLKAIGFDVV